MTQETQTKLAIEFGIYKLRRLLKAGEITRAEFEKSVNGFVSDMNKKVSNFE